jgi:hypothetical protein
VQLRRQPHGRPAAVREPPELRRRRHLPVTGSNGAGRSALRATAVSRRGRT